MNTKSLLLALVAVLAAVSAPAQARPNGAPACAINEAKIMAGMGAPKGDRNFQVAASSMTYTPGQPLSFKVTSATASTKTYKGILIYVEPASDAKKRVGKFTIPQGLKSNVDKCPALQITADTDSIITHNSPADKPLGVDIVWTAPASAMGDLVVHTAVVGTGPANWQILPTMTLKPAGSGEMPASSSGGYGSSSGNNGYNSGGMKKVCKKWRKKPAAGGYGTMPAGDMPASTSTPSSGYSYGNSGAMPAATSSAAGDAPASTGYAATMPAGAAPTDASASSAAAAAPSATDAGAAAAQPTDNGQAAQGAVSQQSGAAAGHASAGAATVAAVMVAVAAMLL